ncbi:sarcosine oxidase subunit gamma [Nereida sp. NH-UV-3]|uniref:sarcosine oxidase subunit gamma n=1 Tax=Nereida TaxID=282198 RepID=UPI0036F1DAA2
MHDLAPITAFGLAEPTVFATQSCQLMERPGIALASVAARLGVEEACHSVILDLLGANAPDPAAWFASDIYSAFWMGPDQWMFSADFCDVEDIAARLKASFGETASITEQTDGWVAFDLTGEVEAVLELVCNVDMRTRSAGYASRVSIHHTGCFLLIEASDRVRVYAPRASAGSVFHGISQAMTSTAMR